MDTISLSFEVSCNRVPCPLTVVVRLDHQQVTSITNFHSNHQIEMTLEDADANHVLEIELQDKLPEHTRIDDQGAIIDDVLITISNVRLDDLVLGQTFLDNTDYSHDFNGTGARTVQVFSGHMGCNGVVRFEFSTPAYLWLLENL